MTEAKFTAHDITSESHFVQVTERDRLHIKRIYCDPQGPPVFMVHGAIENGRIFYSNSNKGLAPYLACHGYDVYVLDLRGRGQSTPAIDRHAHYGQTETITEDIPAALDFIVSQRGQVAQYWIAHSWGGVLLSAYYARFDKHRHLVKAVVYIAVKRCVRVWNWTRVYTVDLLWKGVGPLLTCIYGYLPATKLRLGSDNETRRSHADSVAWVKPGPWRDPEDGFDYGTAIKRLELPPILYLAGKGDKCLGHPNDVYDFMQESGAANAKFVLLSKDNGHLYNYDHINIMTHPKALLDHFPMILQWLKLETRD